MIDLESSRLKTARSQDGMAVQVAIDGYPFLEIAQTGLLGASIIEPGEILRDGDVEMLSKRHWEAPAGTAEVEERLVSAPDGLTWTVEVEGQGAPWGTTLQFLVRVVGYSQKQIWGPWGDRQCDGEASQVNDEGAANGALLPREAVRQWSDPLLPGPFCNRTLDYGASPYQYDAPRVGYAPFSNDILCIPLLTILDKERDTGMSIIISPRDEIRDLTMEMRESGELTFSQMRHRIAHGLRTKWTIHLIVHEADWRGGMRWIVRNYPEYFEPVNPKAYDMGGTSAYSCNDEPFDTEKMKRMAFRTNWRASFDFPYMGMFLPPVANDVEWTSFKKDQISVERMESYARKMHERGFYVLSYFNVFEFGAHVGWPLPDAKEPDGDEWKDCNAYLSFYLKPAILITPEKTVRSKLNPGEKTEPGGPYYTWEEGIIVDCGEPVYREYLLSQAKRLIVEMPASSGICIDRLDWTRMYNEERDDGESWFDDKPARSLVWSWNRLMADLGPLIHEAGKVIFVNNHNKRIDLLKHVDGIFDEFTYAGSPLNTSALLGMCKPVLGWVGTEEDLKPDPDAFFQRFLYLGVFPMAPFPGNDHSLQPGPWVDTQYLDYGPLMDIMRGRRWILQPHAIEARNGSAKTNLFSVPSGFAAPVTFAGEANHVRIIVRGIAPPATVTILHPGRSIPITLSAVDLVTDGFELEVPVVRGCAMVCISCEQFL